MKKLTHFFIFGMLALVIIQLVSCAEETDCSMTARKMMNAGFYKKLNMAQKDTLDTLTVTALGTDSIIINKDAKVSGESLPLNWTADSTALIFHYTNTTKKDTIKIWHTNTPIFVSMECGYSMTQTISKVSYTKHVLDSINVAYKLANVDAIQNIRIYY
ncbi:MAG: calcium-binding protein P [Bacteroidales bacterium]|nr:calcium-binding protein P [Bacteroidales bacterium]